MQHQRSALVFALALAAAGLAATASPAEEGTFVHVSDIHFDPFDPPLLAGTIAATDTAAWAARFAAAPDQTFSRYGEDTNHALFASALAALSANAATADFVIDTGDLLVHRFADRAENGLGYAQGSEANRAFAVRTTLFVLDALRSALPGKPIFVALGNNDSSCGDYEIDPGGSYLAATREAVRSLVGPGLLEPDFDETWIAGGYYAARHPTLPKTLIIALDDVLWSSEYQDACGTRGAVAAQAMLKWLGDRLAAQKAAGGRVWLIQHIPVGIDSYSTSHSKAATCPAKVVPLLKEPYASGYLALIRQYPDVIQATFVGHVHFDDYRLVSGASSRPVALEKIAPAISPAFGQNPGFHLFTYDRATGDPLDFSTIYLTNLEEALQPSAGNWQREYTFTNAYGAKTYGADAVARVVAGVVAGGPEREIFRRLYNISHDELSGETLSAYTCAIGHPDVPSFTACYCGR